MGRRDEYSRQSYIPVPSKEIFDYAFGRVRTRLKAVYRADRLPKAGAG